MIPKGPEKVELIKAVVVYWGQFWQCLETVLTVTNEGTLQTSSGERSGHAVKCYTMYRMAVHNRPQQLSVCKCQQCQGREAPG